MCSSMNHVTDGVSLVIRLEIREDVKIVEIIYPVSAIFPHLPSL